MKKWKCHKLFATIQVLKASNTLLKPAIATHPFEKTYTHIHTLILQPTNIHSSHQHHLRALTIKQRFRTFFHTYQPQWQMALPSNANNAKFPPTPLPPQMNELPKQTPLQFPRDNAMKAYFKCTHGQTNANMNVQMFVHVICFAHLCMHASIWIKKRKGMLKGREQKKNKIKQEVSKYAASPRKSHTNRRNHFRLSFPFAI